VILDILQYIGVAVFAVSGAIAAGRKNLDLIGVIAIASVTAIGGGTLRDVLLGLPVFWLVTDTWLYVIIVSALGTVAWSKWLPLPDRSLNIADALGLALFSVSGAQIAEALGHSPLVVILMGTLTGVAGGVLRDVLSAEIPMILRKGQIYATASIVGAAVYLFLQYLGLDRPYAALTGTAAAAGLRLAAIAWDLTLPVFNLGSDPK
jgi:uncharacterized membrane protein YeiH